MYGSVAISLIIPTLNEEANIPYILPQIPPWIDEVILVDGHSVDQTVSIARELMPDIRVVYQEGRGKGAALRSGFAAATGDIIVMIDADGSTNPHEIPAFVGALLSGADFVKGSRFMQGGGTADMTLFRVVGHWGLLTLVNTIFGAKYTDLCYGYSAFWRDLLPKLQLDGNGFEIETQMNIRVLQIQARVVEVPSFELERIHGEGRLRAIPDGWRVLKTIMRERFQPRVTTKVQRRPFYTEAHNIIHWSDFQLSMRTELQAPLERAVGE
jgi:glycosyltransferase involved in cell wall biosynthesis